MSTHEIEAVEDGFMAATDDNLAHLSEGCFVRVGTGESAYWVELQHIDGERLRGTLHPELSVAPGVPRDASDVVSIRREQITALGCNRYCSC